MSITIYFTITAMTSFILRYYSTISIPAPVYIKNYVDAYLSSLERVINQFVHSSIIQSPVLLLYLPNTDFSRISTTVASRSRKPAPS